jgi:hypothetical protein
MTSDDNAITNFVAAYGESRKDTLFQTSTPCFVRFPTTVLRAEKYVLQSLLQTGMLPASRGKPSRATSGNHEMAILAVHDEPMFNLTLIPRFALYQMIANAVDKIHNDRNVAYSAASKALFPPASPARK